MSLDDAGPAAISRRSLLRAGALTVGLVASGGTFLSFTPATALPTILPISGSTTQLFKNKEFNQQHHRMQSFAFDSKNDKMFAATLRDGSTAPGQLEIARVDINVDAGTPRYERMFIDDAGHGVSFGIEPIGSESYVWIEYGADAEGMGTKLARFRFEAGRHIPADWEDASGTFGGDRQMLSGSKTVTCTVDHVYDYGDGLARLAVRRQDPGTTGEVRYEIYKLHGLDRAPELEWAQKVPFVPIDSGGKTEHRQEFAIDGRHQVWQGAAFYGGKVYSITGQHGADNTYLWIDTPTEPKTINWDTSPAMTRSAAALQPIPAGIGDCEPEGVAVYRPSPTSGTVGLYFGLTGGGTPRTNSVYYRSKG